MLKIMSTATHVVKVEYTNGKTRSFEGSIAEAWDLYHELIKKDDVFRVVMYIIELEQFKSYQKEM